MRALRYLVMLAACGIGLAVFPAIAQPGASHRATQVVFDDGSMITVSTPQLNCTAQSIVRNNDTHAVELKGNVHITISQDGQNVAKIVSNHVRLVPVHQ